MKRFVLAAAAIFAALTWVSCDNEETDLLPKASISAPETFNGAVATGTITLSSAALADGTAYLALGNTPRSGKKLIPSEKLSFDSEIEIKKGATKAEFTIKITDLTSVSAGDEAAVVLANVSVATVGEPSVVYITYDGNTYGSGEMPGLGSLSLQAGWVVTLDGEPYKYGTGTYQDVVVKADDIAYFWLDAYTDEEIAEYYGSVENLVKSWEEENLESLQDGDKLSDILFANGEAGTYVTYPGAGPARIYLVEFNAEGKSTGRIGVTNVTFAAVETAAAATWDIQVPDKFTAKSGLGVEYMGRYVDSDEEECDVFAAVGSGEALWTIAIEDKGSITNVHDYAESMAAYLKEYYQDFLDDYGWVYEWLGEDPSPLDVLYSGSFEEEGYSEFYAMPNGEYDAIVFLFDDNGNLTGEYGLNTVTVDGHSCELPDGGSSYAPALKAKSRGVKGFNRVIVKKAVTPFRKTR
ncbi:MAG: hypothetical protein J5835_06155 [Bacteroidales bacterium]|nr:hypothetical protein [Bacteroidales bacterium]